MKFLSLLFASLLSFSFSFSQSPERDSVSNLQLQHAISLFNHYTDGNAPVFNGTRYLYYTFKREGEPFFLSGAPKKGWIGYQGRLYESIYLFYDAERNQVVILNGDSLPGIVPHNELIDSFEAEGHRFISLKEDHAQNLYTSGFFDLLVDGSARLLAKRIKIMDAVIKDDQVTRRFFVKDRFYIYKGGLYYLVGNKKEVFRLFADNRPELRRLMHQEKVKFTRKNFESALTKTVALYDQLTH